MADLPVDAAGAVAGLSAGGLRLEQFLDDMSVETKWIAGHHIVWQTGQQNGADGSTPEDHTHCSAFVAAVALDLDIYILRPPSHPQELLANAQVAWLDGGDYPGPAATASGWQPLGTSGDPAVIARAVELANAGKLVVGGYLQPAVTDPATGNLVRKPGHVVVVRPQPGNFASATEPLVTMASTRNWRLIQMAAAFSAHPGAWPAAIRLFVHDTDLEEDGMAPIDPTSGTGAESEGLGSHSATVK
ncbi:hypothetical protein [Lichenicola sp.]|uniref:hypothetical protein n=1 Tax=Lichenicola sp. TaxID=2804529 RepID=UPI003AFFDACC